MCHVWLRLTEQTVRIYQNAVVGNMEMVLAGDALNLSLVPQRTTYASSTVNIILISSKSLWDSTSDTLFIIIISANELLLNSFIFSSSCCCMWDVC